MSNFTVRVELHGVAHDSEKYTQLHAEMEKRGFRRTIRIGDISYELPPAEYSLVAEITVAEALTRAKAAALAVMKQENLFSVLVTSSEEPRGHHNLKKVK